MFHRSVILKNVKKSVRPKFMHQIVLSLKKKEKKFFKKLGESMTNDLLNWHLLLLVSKKGRPQCKNYWNLLSNFFDKNFVKVIFLLKKLQKSWFHEIFFWWEWISSFSTLWNSVTRSIDYYPNWLVFSILRSN